MQSGVLAAVLTLGWLWGFLPIKNAWRLGSLQFRWLSRGTVYSLVALTVTTYLQADLALCFLIPYFSSSNAHYLLGLSWLLVDIVHPVVVRLACLWYSSRFVEAVNGLIRLIQVTTQQRHRPSVRDITISVPDAAKSTSEACLCPPEPTEMEAAACTTVTTGKVALKLQPQKENLRPSVFSSLQHQHNYLPPVIFYVPLVAMTIGQTVTQSKAFLTTLLPPVMNGSDFGTYYESFTPNWAPLRLLLVAIATYNGTVSVFYALWLSVGLGTTLLAAHGQLLVDLRAQFKDSEKGRASKTNTVELFENYVQLKDSFRVCGELIGLCLLGTFAWILITIAYWIYTLIWPRIRATELSDLALAVLALVTLVLMGHKLQIQVSRMAEEMKDIVVAAKVNKSYVASEVVEVAQAVVEWRWELTAAGLFPINNTCFAMLLGALVTGTVFVVQLELSETTLKTDVPGPTAG